MVTSEYSRITTSVLSVRGQRESRFARNSWGQGAAYAFWRAERKPKRNSPIPCARPSHMASGSRRNLGSAFSAAPHTLGVAYAFHSIRSILRLAVGYITWGGRSHGGISPLISRAPSVMDFLASIYSRVPMHLSITLRLNPDGEIARKSFFCAHQNLRALDRNTDTCSLSRTSI